MNKTSSPKPASYGNRKANRKCQVHGCKGNAGYYGLCKFHYLRAWRAMRLNTTIRKLPYLDPIVLKVISRPKRIIARNSE